MRKFKLHLLIIRCLKSKSNTESHESLDNLTQMLKYKLRNNFASPGLMKGQLGN